MLTNYVIFGALLVIVLTFAYTFYSLLRARAEIANLKLEAKDNLTRVFESGFIAGRRTEREHKRTDEPDSPETAVAVPDENEPKGRF